MKNTTLCLILVCFAGFLTAQSIVTDPNFGINGLVETDFYDENYNPYGQTMVVLPDGSSVIVGGILEQMTIKKYGNDGTPDAGFTTSPANLKDYTIGLSVQQDGKIIAVGSGAQTPFYDAVVRLNVNGGLDTTFGENGIASVFLRHAYMSHLFQQSNGKIIVYGSENAPNTPTVVTRFDTSGHIDSTFGQDGHFRFDFSNTYEFIPAGLEQPDGKLLFAGMANFNLLLIRLNPDGTIDSTFSGDGFLVDPTPGGGEAYCLSIQEDGKIVVGGYGKPSYKPVIARYLPNGDRDLTFADAGVQYFSDFPAYWEGVGIGVLPNGKILMAVSSVFTPKGLQLAQLLPNGQKDSSFGTDGVYQYPGVNFRPRSFSLNNNTLTISGSDEDSDNIYLLRFILDLNVGTVTPSGPYDSSPCVYPNPVAGPFTLGFGLVEKEQVSIHLYDMNGKQVQSFVQNQSFEKGDHQINLSCDDQLPAGAYILTLEAGGGKRSIRIIKN